MVDKIKVAAYCRVSTNSDDQLNSLDNQIKYFTDYINKHNDWIMCEIFYDEGITGTSTFKRIGFNKMIEEVCNKNINLILTKEVSRFARNTVDTLNYTRFLKSNGVNVIFILDNIDTRDSDSELRLSIMASLAQEESRKISERVKWGQKRKMEQGIVFGRELLGYNIKNGKLYINEEEAKIIKLIYYKFLFENKGTHIIAKELQQQGITPMRAKNWSSGTILKILKNEKYIGDLCQKKTYTPNYLTHKKKYNDGYEEKIYLQNHHEAIIDKDLWEMTQKKLKERSSNVEKNYNYSNRYWCSGKLICNECGKHYVSRTKKLSDGSLYKSWRCYGKASYGNIKIIGNEKVGCDNSSVNEKVLLYVMSYILKMIKLDKINILNDIVKEIKKAKINVDCNINQVYEKIDIINKKKQKSIDLLLENFISKEDLKNQMEIYNIEIENLNKKILEISENYKNKNKDIQIYIDEVNKMINFEEDVELIYNEILDYITICKNNKLIVYLKYIPFGIKLDVTTLGRMENYKVKVNKIEIVKKIILNN